ncbi:MAG: Asp-tRNA(Asn)/Glu-tRNA(Gln) amidotransferase subunit GatC [Bradymonadaceae bacterium]
MAISDEDIRRLARLARLDLDEEELRQYRSELEAILEYVERLEKVEVDAGEGEASDEAGAAERPEEVDGALDREELTEQAPEVGEGAFLVPSVINS